MRYQVVFDVMEEDFDSLGMTRDVDTYEEAIELRNNLIASPIHCNIEIFSIEEYEE